MMGLSNREQRILLQFFTKLDDHDIEYVVLRKYEHLPEYVLGDVDLFVDSEEFGCVVELSEDVGFVCDTDDQAGSTSRLQTVLQNPISAAKTGLTSLASVKRALSTACAQESDDVEICHRQYGEVKLDIMNRLQYPEWGGTCVPTRIEELLLDRRERYRQWYTPSSADELAHIVAHCLADYDGTFPEYYVARCDHLRERILSDRRKQAQFEELLELLFGDDAMSVFSAVTAGKYDSIDGDFSFTSDSIFSLRIPSRPDI